MTKPLYEFYDEIDRDSLPPEFTNEENSVVQCLSNTVRSYRTSNGEIGVLEPRDFPVQRRIIILDNDRHPISNWIEELEPDREFDAHHVWIDLGTGVMPKQHNGIKRALFDLALGYLSGYPIKDVLYYVFKISLSQRRMFKTLEKTHIDTADPRFTRFEERIRIANPLYDERDS